MTGIWPAIAGVGAASALISLIGGGLAAASGPVHAPKPRSNHVRPTPVSGGLGVLLGLAAALAGLAAALDVVPIAGVDADDLTRLAGLMGLGAAAALLGFLDDLFDLPAGFKFAARAGLAVLTAVSLGPVRSLPAGPGAALALAFAPAVVGSALWVFTAANAVNFMDGADGLIGGAGAIAAAGLAVVSALAGAETAAVAAAALAGALSGFLPWNAPRGRVFLGDAGSLLVGVWFAGAALLLAAEAPWGAVYLAPTLIMALLAVVLVTLASRARRGQAVFSAHKDHAYQHLIRALGAHGPATRRIWRRTLLCAVLAVDVAALAPVLGDRTPALALAVLALSAAAAAFWWSEDRRSATQ